MRVGVRVGNLSPNHFPSSITTEVTVESVRKINPFIFDHERLDDAMHNQGRNIFYRRLIVYVGICMYTNTRSRSKSIFLFRLKTRYMRREHDWRIRGLCIKTMDLWHMAVWFNLGIRYLRNQLY